VAVVALSEVKDARNNSRKVEQIKLKKGCETPRKV
jgi:hypothetical protein